MMIASTWQKKFRNRRKINNVVCKEHDHTYSSIRRNLDRHRRGSLIHLSDLKLVSISLKQGGIYQRENTAFFHKWLFHLKIG